MELNVDRRYNCAYLTGYQPITLGAAAAFLQALIDTGTPADSALSRFTYAEFQASPQLARELVLEWTPPR